MNRIAWYCKNLGIAVDQLVNALCGGWADETMSSRAYRESVPPAGDDIPRFIIDALFFWEDEHCKQAYESERNRSQLPPEFRDPGQS